MLNDDREQFRGDARRRLLLVGGCLGGAFAVLCGRLFFLQVMRGGQYRTLAEDNRISLKPISAPRGRIFDRENRILVDNSPNFEVVVTPELAGTLRYLLRRLGRFIDLSEDEVKLLLQQARRQRSFLPLRVKSHLTWEEVSGIEVRIHEFPGVDLQSQTVRSYPFDSLASHVLGYLGEPSDADRKRFPKLSFRSGDLVGKSGVEQHFETTLRGREGVLEMEVNAVGRHVRELHRTPPQAGNDLLLSLDADLQKEGQEALGDNTGAIVVMDPNNGEILALVSNPTYDPNQFMRRMTHAQWQELVTDPNRPLSNKPIQGQYPPGSTFKIVVALAGLAAGKLDPRESVFCGGSLIQGDQHFYCWRRQGHGSVGLVQAITQSCDVYFYKLAERLGIDAIERQARKMGLGAVTGVDLGGERPGLIPSRSWKRKMFKSGWFPGETMITGIGQGYVLTTPLQMASMISTVANGGTVYRPSLLRLQPGQKPDVMSQNTFSSHHLAVLRQALEAVVNDPLGTGNKARLDGEIRVAGKTGTSQVARHKREKSGKLIKTTNEKLQDHAMFVCYAPVEHPKIAISVVVEHGGHGGATAAPLAKRVMESFFSKRDGPVG
ncbi:MAG: penicillin-binding protein 2 [Magnetococcales bacterium]|nr:penicillin-binding protein 2 [Magnetococcales bacterium]